LGGVLHYITAFRSHCLHEGVIAGDPVRCDAGNPEPKTGDGKVILTFVAFETRLIRTMASRLALQFARAADSERCTTNEAEQFVLSRSPAAASLRMVSQFAVAISGHMTWAGDYVNLTGFLVAVGIPECGPSNQQLNP
jgi:hypothetical protein